MVVHVSWGPERKPRGWMAFICPRCQRVVAHRVDGLEETVRVYGFEVSRTTRNDFVVTCDFCGSSVLAKAEAPIVTVPEWSRELGLGPLVETTAPQLADRVTKGGPTETQLRALVDVARARKSAFKRNVNRPAAIAAAVGFLAGPFLGYRLYRLGLRVGRLDAFSFIILGLLAGVTVVPIATAAVYSLLTRWQPFDAHIRAAMARNEIDAHSLVDAAGGVSTAVGRRVQRVVLSLP